MRFLPTPKHTLALTAAIGAPREAVAAYTSWRADGHVPDVEERRLLALIAANVSPLFPDDASLAELHLNRRRTMASHIRRVASCKQIAASLRHEGIDSLFFKGVGMLPWYPDPSLRTMFDADLLVPWQLRHEAIDVLAACGFKPVYRRDLDEMHALTDEYPGWGMQHVDGNEIDVHWRPLHHLRQRPHVDANLFALARLATIASVELVVPDPSHHLVLVLAHGMRATSEAQLISLVDAGQLLRSPDFDADRAAELAHGYQRSTAVVDACNILDELDLCADLRDPVAALRKRLQRRTVADRLIARAAAAPAGPSAQRAQVLSDAWSALPTSLRSGGPLAGLINVVRAQMKVHRMREMPGQLLWLATGRPAVFERFRADRGTLQERRLRLSIGDELRIADGASLSRLLPTGWWEPDGQLVWSQGRESVIDFDLNLGEARACIVVFVVMPFVGHDGLLKVDVRVNRRRVATWEYSVGAPVTYEHRITLTSDASDHGRCQIMFLFDGASSPLESGDSEDARELGLSLISVGIEPVLAPNVSP